MTTESGTSKPNQPMITDKVKILCLHGYRQNGDSFKSKIGSFRKYASKYAEFVFVDAPHTAPPLPDATEADPKEKSWWFNKEDGTFKGTNKAGPAFGFDESLKIVEEVWSTQGPFQGILGFSQGACFAGIICGLAQRRETIIKPEFAIIAAGFKSGSLVHKKFYQEQIEIPSLHVYGKTDDIIPGEMSEALQSVFVDSESLIHDGGHYFAATSSCKTQYITFFQDCLQRYLEKKELLENQNGILVNGEEGDDDDDSD
ncbi:OVCA2 family protein [Megaselia abdita]